MQRLMSCTYEFKNFLSTINLQLKITIKRKKSVFGDFVVIDVKGRRKQT